MSLNSDQFTLKRYAFLIGFCFLSFLLLASLYFFKERIIFADNAFQTFLLIHEKSITIMVDRWPSAVIRFLPLIAVKLGASIQIIMILFSASYALFHLLIYSLTHRVNNDIRFALAIPVTIAILTGHSFFWCASEILQAISLSILIIAMVIGFYRKNQWELAFLLNIIGCVVLAFYHPQSIICVIFGLVYLLYEEKWTFRDLVFPLSCVGIFFLKSMLFPNWYDAMKFEGLLTNIQTYKLDIFKSDSFLDFFQWLFRDLLLYTITFIGVLAMLLRQKKYFKSFLLIFFTLALLVIYNVTNRDSMAIYYAEASYMPLAFFVAIPLVFDTIKLDRKGILVLAGIFGVCILKILLVANIYTTRLGVIEKVSKQHIESKVIVSKYSLPEELKPITWGLPFETLLITTLSDDSKSKTIVGAASQNEYDKFKDLGQFINGMGNVIKDEIDSNYFQLDTTMYKLKWLE